jgi:excisionase family DNA binding protein
VSGSMRLDASRVREMRLDPKPGFPGPIGRPRKSPADSGSLVAAPTDRRIQSAPALRPETGTTPGLPRLVDATEAGAYLGVHPRTIRRLVEQGALRRVQMPCARRRFLVDRVDLDRLIEASKA